MTTRKLYRFKKQLYGEGILFGYAGPVSQGLIEEIGEVIKRKLSQQDTRVEIIRRVFGIFVEQVQNIMNHSAERKPACNGLRELRSGIVVIGSEEKGFYILCGNLVAKEHTKKLIESLEAVESKSRAQLTELYKGRLREASPLRGGGAGLGLIDVARKASRPLEHTLRRVDEAHAFLATKVVIKEDDRWNP